MKKLLSLVMVLSLVLSFSTVVMAEDATTTDATPVAISELSTEFTIYHINDTHARVESGSYAGMGLDKVASLVEAARAEGDNVLFLDAGDTFHGQTIATISQGESIVDIYNAMGVDAMAAGNHDFNYGQDRLVELSGMANFPVLGANVLKADGTPLLEEYTIKEFDGVKVGIFGLSTPETTYKTHPKNVVGLIFEDPAVTAQRMVDTLEPMVDVIICLGHIGIEGDYTSETIIKAVDGIDIFVDGHSHSALEMGTKVNDTLIVQSGEYDKNLGMVDITYNNGEITATASLFTKEMAETTTPSAVVLEVIEAVKAENEIITSVIVGKTDVKLDGERADVRTGQTNLGNLIAESMLDTTGADVAITNGGGIRASIEVGDISQGDAITVLPFGNYVMTIEVTGADIKSVLEVGVSDYPEAKGAFPHIAGMTFKIDTSKEAGSRVWDLKIAGKDVVDTMTYVVATNDFLAAGGDDYTAFEDKKIVNEYSQLDEVLVAYMNANGTASALVDSRITAEMQPTMASGDTYTVVAGDVLWKIAEMYDTTWEALAELNAMDNPNLIFPGDVITLP